MLAQDSAIQAITLCDRLGQDETLRNAPAMTLQANADNVLAHLSLALRFSQLESSCKRSANFITVWLQVRVLPATSSGLHGVFYPVGFSQLKRPGYTQLPSPP